MNLYELSAEIRELENALDWEFDPHATDDEDAQAAWESLAEAYWERLEERDEKVDNWCALISELEHRAEARQREAARLAELSRLDSAKAKRMKDRLLEVFQARDWRRIDARRFRVTLANNGGKTPLRVDAATPEDVPERYRKIVTQIDFNRSAIREDLEAGEELDFARLLPRGQHLRIK